MGLSTDRLYGCQFHGQESFSTELILWHPALQLSVYSMVSRHLPAQGSRGTLAYQQGEEKGAEDHHCKVVRCTSCCQVAHVVGTIITCTPNKLVVTLLRAGTGGLVKVVETIGTFARARQ